MLEKCIIANRHLVSRITKYVCNELRFVRSTEISKQNENRTSRQMHTQIACVQHSVGPQKVTMTIKRNNLLFQIYCGPACVRCRHTHVSRLAVLTNDFRLKVFSNWLKREMNDRTACTLCTSKCCRIIGINNLFSEFTNFRSTQNLNGKKRYIQKMNRLSNRLCSVCVDRRSECVRKWEIANHLNHSGSNEDVKPLNVSMCSIAFESDSKTSDAFVSNDEFVIFI